MNNYIKAFELGRAKATQDHLVKIGSAAGDTADLLSLLARGGKNLLSGLGSAGKAAGGAAIGVQRGGKYLGTRMDPRLALMLGGGAALAAGVLPAAAALEAKGTLAALKEGAPATLAGLGGLLAGASNPGVLGGSATNRISHELAMQAATPAGMVATMAGLVGLPAALIGYGKMKGKEESSLF